MKRTFIAVPVEASVNLIRLTGRLKEEFKKESMKWVDPAIIHITLQFLGDTPEDMVMPVAEKLELLSEKFRVEEGTMVGLGAFSNNRKPSVLYTRLVDLPILEQMAAFINENLQVMGFHSEKRKFKPHLTLARIRNIQDKRDFMNVIRSYNNSFIQNVIIDRVIFFESILLPQGPFYKPLKTVSLKSANQEERMADF